MVPVLVPLWEAPLEVLFWYGCETCCHVLLNFFFGYRALTFEASLEVRKSQKLHKNLVNAMAGDWLEFGSSLKSAVL